MQASDRRVTLRLPDSASGGQYFTVRTQPPGATPTPANHGALAHLATTDPARAERLTGHHATLMAREAEFFAWLEADAGHTHSFLADPAAALAAALPGLPAALLADFADK